MASPVGPFRFGSRWRYGRYDGTGQPIRFDATEILSDLTEDLVYHGDLAAALRRLMREGFEGSDGERVQGLDEIMRQIAQRRRDLADRPNNTMAQHVADELREILATERAALEGSSDPDSMMRSMQLELLPEDLLGKLTELSEYEFASSEAQERFDDLLAELREDLIQAHLDSAAAQVANATPEERARLRDALAALNDLLEKRANGEDVEEDFSRFMDEFGDLFPGSPSNLDELIAQLAQRMAAASAMVASMSPEQRRQFEALSEALLSDLDLSWQLDRLGLNLRDALPNLHWDEQLGQPSGGGLPFFEGADAVDQLSRLSELEQLLGANGDPDALRELDLGRVEEVLGADAARSLEALSELTRRLEEAGLVARREGELKLTPAGVRQLGSNALRSLFASLRQDRLGNHATVDAGLGHDRAEETKPYEFGDPFRLDLRQTLRNATLRQAYRADGTNVLPIRLQLDDFEIERSEHLTTASTVLAIDLSLSMPMEDNFLAAKKVTIALQSLIAARYPRDYLGIVGFSATAREIDPLDLPSLSWDFAYGTNLQHTLMLARKMLSKTSGAKQVILITDGEPTAHVEDDGEVFFNYPAVPETIERTLVEVRRCTREHIVINSFVLGATGALRSFVDRMTRLNRGRAFYTTPETLGDYLLVDFVSNHTSNTNRIRPGS